MVHWERNENIGHGKFGVVYSPKGGRPARRVPAERGEAVGGARCRGLRPVRHAQQPRIDHEVGGAVVMADRLRGGAAEQAICRVGRGVVRGVDGLANRLLEVAGDENSDATTSRGVAQASSPLSAGRSRRCRGRERRV